MLDEAACQPREQAAQDLPVPVPVVATIGDKTFHDADIDAEINALPERFQSLRHDYDQHQDQCTTPEKVHARHILVSSREKAEEVIRLLRHGKDFAALAAEYSIDDSNKGRGEDLNWFSRAAMVKPFEKAVFALEEPGDISKPVKTKFGWHVIALLGRRPASRQSLKEARGNIMGILRQQVLSGWIDGIVRQSGSRIINSEYRTIVNPVNETKR